MPSDSKSGVHLSAPWGAFFDELDSLLPEPVELHCIGGFVSTVLYGVPRVTADVDYVAALPRSILKRLPEVARFWRENTKFICSMWA